MGGHEWGGGVLFALFGTWTEEKKLLFFFPPLFIRRTLKLFSPLYIPVQI